MNRARAAAEFAQWLEETHPEVYEALYAHAMAQHAGLSGLGEANTTGVDTDWADYQGATALQDIQVDTGNLDYVTASMYSDAVDALPGLTLDFNPTTDSVSTAGTQSTPMSSGGGVTSGTAQVGSWLTSPQGLTAIANLGGAVLNTIATTQAAKAQMAVIQAQAQKAQMGQSPTPITYVKGANGETIPVYVAGNQTLPNSLVNAVNSGISQPIGLPNGQTGYTLNNSTLSSVLGKNSLVLLAGLGVLLLLLVGQS